MKRFVITFLSIIIVIGSYAQRTVNLETMEELKGVGNTVPRRDVEMTADGVVVTYHFNNVIVHKDPLYRNASIVKIDGFFPNGEVGDPLTLARWDSFIVPNNQARVIVIDSSYVEMKMELSPARPVLWNSSDETYTKENVKPIRYYDGLFPSSVISAVRNDCYRRQPLLDVCVSPLQYDCSNKKLRAYTKIKYKIQYNLSELETEKTKNNRSDVIKENTFLENVTLNSMSPNRVNSSYPLLQYDDTHYLIISVPKYAAAVNRLAEWKRTLGFYVDVVLQENWDSTEVKNTVRASYNSCNLDYLLIFGGQNDVPSCYRCMFLDNSFKVFPTDLYYGCMTAGYTPDIYRGRIPVTTLAEANIVVDKIIEYERHPVTDSNFYNKSIHCAYFQDRNYYDLGLLVHRIDSVEDRRFVLTSERIRNRMLSIVDSVKRVYYTEDSIYPSYWNNTYFAYGDPIPTELKKNGFPWNGNTSDIINLLNNKAFYLLMRDHGDINGWSYPSFTTDDIANLVNGRYLPVVFSICCLTGRFDYGGCFCETFLKKEDGGCVAIFGASRESLSGYNDVLSEGMFDAIWPSTLLWTQMPSITPSYTSTPSPTYRLGQILDQGLKRVREAYPSNDYLRYTHQIFHCFGDPSMMITTAVPTEFSNASIVRTNGSIYVDTGGETAKMTFYNRRTGQIESFGGTSCLYNDDPEISVCISGHNKIPYIDAGTLFIQNKTLTQGGYFEAKKIKVGENVTSTQNTGAVGFIQGNYKLVGSEVELNSGTNVSLGVQLEINNP